MIKQSLFCFALLAGMTVQATSLVVSNSDDSGTGSLRDQIFAASSGDTIRFDAILNGGTIVLTSGQILIDKALVIIGPGSGNLSISGNMASRIFISNGGDLSISGLTLTGGNLVSTPNGDGGALRHSTIGKLTLKDIRFESNDGRKYSGSQGGAVWYGVYGGEVDIDSCIFNNNYADDMGGAITCNVKASKVHIRNCWIDGNTSGRAGALFSNADTLWVENTTISNNSAGNYGSVYLGNNAKYSSVRFINTTFSNNIASSPYRTFGTSDGELVLINSTFYLNNEPIYIKSDDQSDTVRFTVHNCIFHNYGPDLELTNSSILFTSLGGNVSSDTTMNFFLNQSNDTTQVAPMLYPLADNGGLMHTHALMPGSPAIKNGTSGGPQLDQLGNTRTYFDAGALDFICPVATSTDILNSCGPLTWIDGNTYTSSNTTATYVLMDAAASGCDSVIKLNLTVNTIPDDSISRNGRTLTANQTSASYVWLDCDDNFSAVPNETSQSFTLSQSGNYAVEVTENGCIDTSDCINIDLTGIADLTFAGNIRVFPNPTNGMVTLEFNQEQTLTHIELRTVTGQVLETYTFNQVGAVELTLGQAPGIYFLLVNNEQGDQAIFRLVKE